MPCLPKYRCPRLTGESAAISETLFELCALRGQTISAAGHRVRLPFGRSARGQRNACRDTDGMAERPLDGYFTATGRYTQCRLTKLAVVERLYDIVR
jgi:hypothetical protein